MNLKKFYRWSAISLAMMLLPAAQTQAAYPDRPVKLVITYPAGGPTDLIARKLAQKLTEKTGANFVVENKGGAGGNIGANEVVKSAPDGYTLLFLVVGHAINMSLYKNPGFDVQKDLTPVSPVASSPLILLTNVSFPTSDVKEMLELFKSKPGGYTYGSAGIGSAPHLAMELLKKKTGIDLLHIPYRGGAPALTALMGGETSVMFDSMVTGSKAAQGGKIKAIAVSGSHRSAIAPQVPTIAETAVPGFEAITWYGIAAPAGTPKSVVQWLNSQISSVLAESDVRQQFADWGAEPMKMSPDEFGDFIKSETAQWGRIIKETGATAD